MITADDVKKIREQSATPKLQKGKITADMVANIRQNMAQQPVQQPVQQPTPQQTYNEAVAQAGQRHGQLAQQGQRNLAQKQAVIYSLEQQQRNNVQDFKTVLENYSKENNRLPTDPKELKALAEANGLYSGENKYQIDKLQATQGKNPVLNNEIRTSQLGSGTIKKDEAFDKSYGKREGQEEFKSLDFTSNNNSDKYEEYKQNLEIAKENKDTRNIAKYSSLLEEYKKKYKELYGNTKLETKQLPGLKRTIEQEQNDLNELSKQYLNATTPQEKNNIAVQFNRVDENLKNHTKAYQDTIAWDEIVNKNIAVDSMKSLGKNVTGGTASILNAGYTLGTKLIGDDATTINANALLNYTRPRNAVSNTIQNIASVAGSAMNPLSTITGINESPDMAYLHLTRLRATHPENQRLANLYNEITNKTFKGTAEDLKNELDTIQKELYQYAKDNILRTQDELDAVADQVRHNETYGSLSMIPNAFGTVGNMIPSMIAGAGIGEVGSMAMLGLNAGSSAMDQALQSGARYNQALNYGILSGGTEVATEKMFDTGANKLLGIKGGLDTKGLANRVIDGLGIKSKVGKVIANTAFDVGGEMVEEMVAEAVNPLWKALSYEGLEALPQNGEELGQYIKDIINAGVEAIPSTLLMQGGGAVLNTYKTQQLENGLIKSINESDLSQIVKNQLINEVRKASTDVKLGLEESNYIQDKAYEKGFNLAAQSEQMKQQDQTETQNAVEIPQSSANMIQNVPKTIGNEPIVAESLQNNAENEQKTKLSTTTELDDLRSFKKVGDRKVNAYQYDNPEVKPFFQYEAGILLDDLNNAIKGERYMVQGKGDYGLESYGTWDGTKRAVVQDIADLLDGKYGTKLSYDDIRKGLNAIINDNGAENIAAAKRIEMVLDKRLRKGYTDSFGYEHNQSENYNKFLNGEEYVDPEKYDYDYLVQEYGEPGETNDGTLFSLSEKEQQEISQYADKLENDKTLDNDFASSIFQKLGKVRNYSDFENIKQEVEDYKDKMYKGISGLEDIANMKESDVVARPLEYKQRVDKNTTEQRGFFENMETSPIVAEETKNRVNATTYEQQGNSDTLEEMRQKLDERGNDLIDEWKTKSKNFTAKDVALGAILVERYQQNGDWDSAARAVEKLADMGTEAGRAVQMYSIFQRLSPETMAIYQQKALNQAFEEMKQRKTGKWVEANKDKFKLTDEDTKFIYEQVEKASQAIDDETKQRELSKIEKRINEKLPAKAGDAIRTLRRISMLFNPKTQVRNVVGNSLIMPVNAVTDFVGTQIDKAIAKKTGTRTTNYANPIEIGKGFVKGIKAAVKDYKTGTRTAETGNKWEFEFGSKPFNENTKNKAINAASRKLNKLNDLLSAIMSGGDRPFYEGAFNNSLKGQMKANKVDVPTQDMIDIAVNEALQRTWNDDNEYTKTVLGIRKAMNGLNVHGFGLGDLIIPFARTPANLTKAMVEYSPVGFIPSVMNYIDMNRAISRGELTPQQQKKFVSSMSKAIAGTMLYAIAGTLARGIGGVRITGSADDDKDVKNFEQNVLGIQPYSVILNGKSYTYSWANPINAPLAIMADSYKLDQEDANLWDKTTNLFKVAGNVLTENSFLQGIQELFSKDSLTEGLVDSITGMPESLVPTFISQIASAFDNKKRQTFEYKNDLGTITNKIKNKLPGAKNTLAPQVNTFGEEIDSQNNFFNVFLNPANVREAEITDSQKALYEVYQETKDKTIFPMQAPYYTNTDTGEKKNLSSKERVAYQKASGQYVTEVYDDLFNNEAFNNSYHINNEAKTTILKKIAEDGNAKGREAVGAISSDTNSNLDKLNERNEMLNNAGIPLADYYIAWYSQKNVSKKQAKKTAISQQLGNELDKEQKEVLYGIFNID